MHKASVKQLFVIILGHYIIHPRLLDSAPFPILDRSKKCIASFLVNPFALNSKSRSRTQTIPLHKSYDKQRAFIPTS